MSFFLYLLYVAFSILRPFELALASLAPFRPMLVLYGLAFMGAIFSVATQGKLAIRAAEMAMIVGLWVAIALSHLAYGRLSSGLSAFTDFSTAAMLLLLTVMNVTDLKRLRITIGVLVACVCFMALLSLRAYFTGALMEQMVIRQLLDYERGGSPSDTTVAPAQDTSGTYLWRLRSVGFLNDPNDFAQVMVMLLPMLWLLRSPNSKVRTILLIAPPAALLLYTIYLTHSRGALVGLAAMAMVLIYRRFGRTALITMVVTGALTVAGLQFGGRAFSTNEASARGRLDAWNEGIEMLKSHPIVGVGYGNFNEHHERTAHNSFVLGFSELGLLGYFCWIALIVQAWVGLGQAMRQPRSVPSPAEFAFVFRVAVVGFFVCAWFLSRTYQPLLYLLLGLCFAIEYLSKPTAEPVDSPTTDAPAMASAPWAGRAALFVAATIVVVHLQVRFS